MQRRLSSRCRRLKTFLSPITRQEAREIVYETVQGFRGRETRMGRGGLVSAALVLVACALGLEQAARWLDPPTATQKTDAIVVLGGELPLRVGRGAALYKAGLAPELWITGDSPSPQALAQVARQQGVPEEAIHILPTTSTWDDGRETAALAKRRGLHGVLVVTSWYHHRRALCVLKQELADSGIQVFHDSVPNFLYDRHTWWRHPDGWFNVFREIAAIGFYAVRHGLVVWNCA
jgi:uncharacterized SAM-binding protein YcdF (DUF218 family)